MYQVIKESIDEKDYNLKSSGRVGNVRFYIKYKYSKSKNWSISERIFLNDIFLKIQLNTPVLNEEWRLTLETYYVNKPEDSSHTPVFSVHTMLKENANATAPPPKYWEHLLYT